MSLANIWEWLGVVTALVYVVLATKGNRWCFLFGLISSVIFVDICFSDHLYFDTAINSYYVVMSLYGWFTWKGDAKSFTSKKMNVSLFLILSLTSLIVSFILGFLSSNYSDASLPYIDSFTTVFAVFATWLLVKKYLQNWLIWIVTDAVSIFMYSYKEHYPIALLFAVYTAISFYGYINWKRNLLESD